MMNISSSASNEHASTQASHALDSLPVATNFDLANIDCEHADGPSDYPIVSHQLATGANDGNAAQAAAAVNSVKCATQLNHSSPMSTTSGSETSDDSMNPRLDNLTPPESPGEADPLYTASTAYGRAPSQPTLPRAQHANLLEQKPTAKGRQSVHSPKSHLRNASNQLAAEVKGIYAGLIMVESKCINIDAAQASECPTKLAREQWQALVALHRTLLYEHYDFLMATQHPLAIAELKALPARYCMPARMWKHAIHSFLEVLRHRRPDSHEYMLAFVYLTYQMMALLLETVPSFEDTWVECLGDLARYRMAIEEDRDLYSHWAGVASSWYIKATDKHPEAGRLYHHLGILERPSLQKFACYGKSQTCVIPFPNTKDSMTLLCTPLAEDENAAKTATRSTEASLCRMFALIYLQKPPEAVDVSQKSALELLERPGGFRWKDNGVALAISSTSAFLEHGSLANPIRAVYDSAIQQHLRSTGSANAAPSTSSDGQTDSQSPREPAHPANQPLLTNTRDIIFAVLNSALRHGVVDDILPCVHVMLLFLNSLILMKEHHNHHHHTVGKLLELEGVSWGQLSLFLNTLVHLVGGLPQEVISCALRGSFSLAEKKSLGRFLLPEDFTMRGLVWSYFAYDSRLFDDCGDPHERFVESSRTVEARRERVLYYGLRLAFESSYLTFDPTTSTFKASAAETSNEPTSCPVVPPNAGAKHTSVVGQPGMPSPAARPKGPKLKFTAEDDALLLELRETKNLTWRQIAEFFPGRASGLPQLRYGNLLKARTTTTSTASTYDDPVCRPHSSRKQRDGGVGDRTVQIADPDAMNWEGVS
ncbi:hypothetical protein KC354_g12763 [Hortaea werneckii]|nr:hypothetical protein KC354_g12763 [Hortaea werneckii]